MDILREAVGQTPIRRGAWRFLVKHTRQSHWARMDFERTLWMTLPSTCVHLGEGWEPVHTEWFIFPKCHKWRNGTFGRQLGMSFKKTTFPKSRISEVIWPHMLLSSQEEEMRILGHCWPETALIVSKNDPLSVHIRWTPALCQPGPVKSAQHSVFLTVSPGLVPLRMKLLNSPSARHALKKNPQSRKFGRHWLSISFLRAYCIHLRGVSKKRSLLLLC